MTLRRTLVLIALGYALVLAAYHLEQARSSPYYAVPLADAEVFDRLGRRLAEGGWRHPEFLHQAPLYPLLVGALYAVFGPHMPVVYALQGLLALAALLLCAALAHALYGPRAAVLAAALLGLYAPLLFFSTKLESGVLSIACGAAALLYAVKRRPLAAGLTATLATMVRPEMALFAAAAGASFMRDRKALARFAAPVAVLMVAVFARNYGIAHRLTWGAGQAGFTFYGGNHAGARGLYAPPPGFSGRAAEQEAEERRAARAVLGRLPEPGEAERLLARKALAEITHQPAAWLLLEAKKALRFALADEPRSAFAIEDERDRVGLLALCALPFPVLLVLGLMALVRAPPAAPARLLCAAYVGVHLLVVLVFFMTARYRAPVAPALAALAAGGALHLARRARPWLAAAAAVALLCLHPLDSTQDRAADRAVGHYNAGVAWTRGGKPERALPELDQAVALNPTYGYEIALGNARAAAGDREGAHKAYMHAAERHPERPAAWTNLGILAAKEHDPGAESLLRRGVATDPEDAEAHVALAEWLSTGRPDEASAELRRALAVEPGQARALAALAGLFARQGQRENAKNFLHLAAVEAPAWWPPRHNLALLEEADGDRSAARRAYEAAVWADPRAYPSHYNLGLLLLEDGDIGRARSHLRTAAKGGLTIDPKVRASIGIL